MGAIIVLGVLLVVALVRFVVYPAWFSPLAKIPNAHWLAPYTPLWMLWRRYKGEEVSTVWDAIQTHGSIVRLGPKELLVNTYHGGVRTIYGGVNEKPDWYDFYINHGKRNIFTSLGKDHVIRRRRLTNIFSKSYVQHSPHVRAVILSMIFDRYLPTIFNTATAQNGVCGVLGLNLAYGLDSVSNFMVGLPRGSDFINKTKDRAMWLQDYLLSHPSEYMFWLLDAPNFTAFLIKLGWNPIPKSVKQAHQRLETWGWDLVDKSEAALSTTHTQDLGDGEFPLLYSQLRLALTQERRQVTKEESAADSFNEQRDELASEILDQLVATRDVFGITLSYIIWEISRHPDWQKALQDELRSIKQPLLYSKRDERHGVVSCQELESLPMLNIIVKESMRLRTTLPVPNPRLTPHGKTTTIGPYENIPGGVRTNSFAWCMHRDPSVYPDPLQWKPERWLRPDGQRQDMDNQFWAFGSGSRLCLGMSLAMEMIRHLIAAIYTNFTTTIVDDSHFGVDGKFVTGLPGEDLVLHFAPLDAIESE